MNEGPPKRRPLSRGKKLLFSAGILISLFVVAEVGWRLILWRTGRGFFDDPSEFTSVFFTTYEEPPPFTASGVHHFVGSSVPVRKHPREIRVICFGGSTTINPFAGISYAALLEERFGKERSPYPVRVLCAGGEGYSTAHTLVNLGLRNLEVEPDIVTVYHNLNDLSAVWIGSNLEPDYTNKYKSSFYLGFRHRTGLIAELAKISRLWRFLFSKAQFRIYAHPEHLYTPDFARGLRLFRRNLESIVAIAKVHGVRVMLGTQAADSVMGNRPGFREYNETVREVAAKHGIPFADVERVVVEDRMFVDGLHYTREGVEMVADTFYEPLSLLVEEVRAQKRGNARTPAPPDRVGPADRDPRETPDAKP